MVIGKSLLTERLSETEIGISTVDKTHLFMTLRLVPGTCAAQTDAVALVARVVAVELSIAEGVVSTQSTLRPLLIVDGAEITSTFAIVRYLIRVSGRVVDAATQGLLGFVSERGFLAIQSISREEVSSCVAALTTFAQKSQGELSPFTALVLALATHAPVELPSTLEDLLTQHRSLLDSAGVASRSCASVRPPVYLTTAINYTNGPPHIGHAYEAIVTDVMARYSRVAGSETLFCTGTDEHGQKIASSAEAQGLQPQELCDKYATAFQELNKELLVSNDIYIRTTQERHKKAAQKLWDKCLAAGDIYLGKYVGWYNVREETFVTELNARESDYKDPISGVPLRKMEEESYFFRLSKYVPALKAMYLSNPNLIQPDNYRQEILAQLEADVEDLSISRSNFSWGVPVPNDTRHVMYVWFDALSNYISAVGYADDAAEFSKFWPAEHIIGKDIIRFHCIIWPAMLMSAGLVTPKCVVVHGFITAADGRKMSKSLGNVVDPWDVVRKYPVDTVRYFSCHATRFGLDLKFDAQSMEDVHNAHLADLLGNLVGRASALVTKSCNGVVPAVALPATAPFNLDALRTRVERAMKHYHLDVALELILEASKATNKYLTDTAPWAIKGDPVRQQQIIRTVLEALYILAHFYSPFLVRTCEEIFRRLNTPPMTLDKLSRWFDNLQPGTPFTAGDVLFVKMTKPVDQKPMKKSLR